MKIRINHENYNFEMDLDDAMDNSEVLEVTGDAMCHVFLDVITRYAGDEEEAREMVGEVFEHLSSIFAAFFEQGVFEKFHQPHESLRLYRTMVRDFENWIPSANINIDDIKNRYQDLESFNISIYADDTSHVNVDIVDRDNSDTVFVYSRDMLEEDEFEISAFIDLMRLVVLGDKLFGEEHNILREISPEKYVEMCVAAFK